MLSNPRPLFGIHQVTPYNRSTGQYYGTLKVLKGSTLNVQGSLVKLEGGSQNFPWAVETGSSNGEVQLKVGEFPDFLYTLFYGTAPTSAGVSATGSVSTLTNKYGTSVVNATTGIASIGIIPTTGAANLKAGKYVLKAASSTTVHIYASTDADFNRGTAGEYQDDDLRVTASALTITSGANTDLAAFGLRLVGGSGTIGLTSGDTALFEVLPPSTKSMSVVVGSVSAVNPEFGMLAVAQKTGQLQLTELDIFRCKGVGFPLGMQPHAFAEADIKIECFYDSSRNGVFGKRWVEESS